MTSCDQLHNDNWQNWEWGSIASAWWMTNLVTLTVTKCDQNMIRERSDPLAASAASQAGRSVLRGAIAQRSALQLLVQYGTESDSHKIQLS